MWIEQFAHSLNKQSRTNACLWITEEQFAVLFFIFIMCSRLGRRRSNQITGVAVCCSVLQCVAVCCSVLQLGRRRSNQITGPLWMSHVSYEWVMSHMNESCLRSNQITGPFCVTISTCLSINRVKKLAHMGQFFYLTHSATSWNSAELNLDTIGDTCSVLFI